MSATLPAVRRAWLRAQRELGCDEIFLDRTLRLPQEEAPPPVVVAPAPVVSRASAVLRPQRPPSLPVTPVGGRVGANTMPPPPVPIPERPPVLRAPQVPLFASRTDLDAHVQACGRCRLKDRVRCVWAGGAATSDWLVLTLYGWGEDLAKGELLAGAYAANFWQAVQASGLPNPSVAAVLCCPPRDPADVSVQGRIEAARCRPYWTQVLRLSGARAVLVLDHKALQLALGRAVDWKAFRGRDFELEGVPALATHHPARLARSAALAPEVEGDLRRIRSIIGGRA